jgi:hypothetical protein
MESDAAARPSAACLSRPPGCAGLMGRSDWLRPGSRATERSAPNPRAHDIRGVYFTCLLDDRSCAACRIADDGLLRRMDEPSRIRAPHPQCTRVDGCLSNARPQTLPPDDWVRSRVMGRAVRHADEDDDLLATPWCKGPTQREALLFGRSPLGCWPYTIDTLAGDEPLGVRATNRGSGGRHDHHGGGSSCRGHASRRTFEHTSPHDTRRVAGNVSRDAERHGTLPR